MNFTREPIIETVITPREGCKLVIRSSKAAGQEEYLVDAVEVVSFGNALFFRSQERPKSFLVPMSDYEVLESKEARMVLKSSSADQAIKIGGGRDAPQPQRREPQEDATLGNSRPAPERSQERKRRRGRRGQSRHQDQHSETRQEAPIESPSEEHAHEAHQEHAHQEEQRHEPVKEHESGGAPEQRDHFPEENKSPSFISKLFPPPANLVSKESLSRYKTAEAEEEKPFEPELPEESEE